MFSLLIALCIGEIFSPCIIFYRIRFTLYVSAFHWLLQHITLFASRACYEWHCFIPKAFAIFLTAAFLQTVFNFLQENIFTGVHEKY